MDEPDTRFLSAKDEMVACAPILEVGLRTVTFKTDMMKACGMIYVINRDLECWNYVTSAQRKRYRRKSYRDLWDHFLGTDNVDNMASEAESLLAPTHYSGERKWFNFERYVKIKRISTISLK